MLCNLGINSLKKVIFLMVIKSHSTTSVMNKFGKLLLEVKRIGTTVIMTKLSLGYLFCLLTLPWSTSNLALLFIYGNNLIIINVTYIFIFILFFIQNKLQTYPCVCTGYQLVDIKVEFQAGSVRSN